MTDVTIRIIVTFPEVLDAATDHKLDRLLTLVQQGNHTIMSQLSDILSQINDETNLIATSAAADALQTEANAVAVQALRDQIAILIANGAVPTAADLAAVDAIHLSLRATNTSLVATAARLAVIAADPTNPVPTP